MQSEIPREEAKHLGKGGLEDAEMVQKSASMPSVLTPEKAALHKHPSAKRYSASSFSSLTSSSTMTSDARDSSGDTYIKSQRLTPLPKFDRSFQENYWKVNAEYPFLNSFGSKHSKGMRHNIIMLPDTVEEERGEENESAFQHGKRISLIRDNDEFNRGRVGESSNKDDHRRHRSLDVKRNSLYNSASSESKKKLNRSKFGDSSSISSSDSKTRNDQRMIRVASIEQCIIKEDDSEYKTEESLQWKHSLSEGRHNFDSQQPIDKMEPFDENKKKIEYIPETIAEERGEGEYAEVTVSHPELLSALEEQHEDTRFVSKLKEIEDQMIVRLTPRKNSRKNSRTCSVDIQHETIPEEEDSDRNDLTDERHHMFKVEKYNLGNE